MKRIAMAGLLALVASVFAQLVTVEAASAAPLTSISATLSAASVTFGTPVTVDNITVTGDSGNGVPTANVTVTVDGGSPQQVGPNGNDGVSVATYPSVDLGPLGVSGSPHTIAIAYNGGDNYDAAGPNAIGTVTVTKANTTVSATPSNPTPTFGTAITVSGNVGGPTPFGGTVTITEGANVLGTAGVNANGSYAPSSSFNSLGVGSHTLTATYGGDGNHTGSSTTTNVTVSQAATSVSTPVATPATPTFGQTVTLTGTVSSGGGTPTGSVDVLDNGGAISTNSPLGGGGSYSVPLNGLAVGAHSFVVHFHDGTNFANSDSAAKAVTVGPPVTTISFTSSGTTTYGAPYSVTGKLTSNAGTPGGNVSITVDGGGATQVALDGTGSFTMPIGVLARQAAAHPIAVTYAANGNFAGATNTLLLTVNKAPVTVVASGPAQTFPGLPVPITVTVTPAGTLQGGAAALTGTVTAPNSNGPVTLSGGAATVTLNPITVSTSASVTYSGDNNYATQGATTSAIAFSKYAVDVTIVDSNNCKSPAPSCANVPPGVPMPLKAVVSLTAGQPAPPASVGSPTGTIHWSDSRNNAFWTPQNPAISGGVASTIGQFPAAGNDDVTASYAGNANFAASTSPVMTVGVPNADHNTRYVYWVYNDLLNRAPDQGGLSYWAGLLNGGTPRPAVAWALVNSNEYRARVIAGMYADFLNRPTDTGGLNYWVNQVAGGMTFEWFQSFLIGSDEYYFRGDKGAGNPTKFVTSMYEDVLGRGPDTGGLNFFVSQLNAGVPRARVVSAIVFSTEHLATTVDGYYEHFLSRAADAGGQNYWVGQLQRGSRDEVIVALIIGSDEYYSLV